MHGQQGDEEFYSLRVPFLPCYHVFTDNYHDSLGSGALKGDNHSVL